MGTRAPVARPQWLGGSEINCLQQAAVVNQV